MRSMQRPKLIYFTAGPVPTDDEMEAVANYSGRFKPVVRNGAMVPNEGNAEHCVAVAGYVPALYQHFQRADEFDPSKEPKLGTIRMNERGQTVLRELSPKDGTPGDRTLFTPPSEALPAFKPSATPANGWKPNA